MADRTGGEYFYANTAEELISYFLNINVTEKYDITTDSDSDGIPDVFISDNDGIYFEMVANPEDEDTDGDGIIDGNEVTNVTSDPRYDYLHPLESDTIQTLFLELTDLKGLNQENNAVYIQVENNNITIKPRIVFKGSYELKALDCLYDDRYLSEESTDIINNLGEDCTLLDLFLDGIERRWSSEYFGTKFDFYPGMDIYTIVVPIVVTEPSDEEHYITVNVTQESGASSTSDGFDMLVNKTINMRNMGCEIAVYEGISAHEFGHTLLLADAYPSANHNYTLVISDDSSKELYCTVTNAAYGRPGGGEIMYYNSDALLTILKCF
ncbi:MAG: hypothetical protein NC485_12895 [Ruminococcus flavefaciens]|nr:hypothetical protein [Ruminococcus flavefaciens]MCM1061694.1 hypothetical protein [Eubacterium sp.]